MTIEEILKEYVIRPFPKKESANYILLCKCDDTRIPFYVGETDNLWVRMRDYLAPGYAAPTDFKVGIAIKYFIEKGMEVELATQSEAEISNKRRTEEIDKASLFRSQGYLLINDLKGYKYETADRDDETLRIWLYCDEILKRQGLHDT